MLSIGRFTVESKLVIDGKNNDNGRGGATVNVGSRAFDLSVGYIHRWIREDLHVHYMVKWRNREAVKL
jgi:hypothetical protein